MSAIASVTALVWLAVALSLHELRGLNSLIAQKSVGRGSAGATLCKMQLKARG